MKALCMALVALTVLTTTAQARLGESLKEIRKRYGRPLNYSQSLKIGQWRYDKPGLIIVVLFNNSNISVQEQIIPYKPRNNSALTDKEIHHFIFFTSGKRIFDLNTLPKGSYIVDTMEEDFGVTAYMNLAGLRCTILPETARYAVQAIPKNAWNHPDNVQVRASKDGKIRVIELLGSDKVRNSRKFVLVIDRTGGMGL